MIDLNNIDPEWAWEPWQPAGGQWSRRDVAHLYRRAGIAANSVELDDLARKSPQEVVQGLVNSGSGDGPAPEIASELAQSALATDDARNLSAWWAYLLLNTPHQLLEKTTLFWHGHFATSAEKVTDPRLMFRQNELLRKYSLGDFGKLLHEISRDPAMLIYLDSVTNRKAHPNENYAREIMELFFLGEGNYSEADIRELARCFTGWEIRRDAFRFNRYQHDAGSKSIFGTRGEFGGDEGVDIVLRQDNGPRFLCYKLVRFFVLDEPAPSPSLVQPLAEQLRRENLRIGPVIEKILTSNLFFDSQIRGRKVRSPVEYTLGTLRALEASSNMYSVAQGLAEMGQELFFPPSVKGWDGGRTWINSSTLLARANVLQDLLRRKETRFAGETLATYVGQQNRTRPDEVVDWLSELLLAVELSQEVRTRIARHLDHGPGDQTERLAATVHMLCTLPEFQLA